MPRWMLPSALLLALVFAVWLFAVPRAVPAGPSTVNADEPPTVHEVASELMCQCGCAMTVAACQEAMECSVADGMVADIQRQIDAGKSKQEILDGLATVYGEEVLASPRKSGFSLTVWVAPFLAVAAGGVVVSAVIWTWVRRRPASAEASASPFPVEDLDPYEERVDEELRLLE